MERRGFRIYVELSGVDVYKMLWHSIHEARSFGYLIKCSTIRTSIAMLIINARGRSVRGRRKLPYEAMYLSDQKLPKRFPSRQLTAQMDTMCNCAHTTNTFRYAKNTPKVCEISS